MKGEKKHRNALEHISGHIKETVTGNSVDLLRGKSHLTILIAFYDKMTRSTDVGRAVDAAQPQLPKLSATMFLGPS